MEYLIIFFVSLLSFGLSAICGGGAGLLLIPLLGRFLDVKHVPAALSLGTASSSFSRIVTFYKDINWKIVYYFLPTALPAAWLGSWLLSYINPIWVELIMSLFLIGNLPQIFKNDKKDYESNRALPYWSLILIGFLAGFISGITGAEGMLFNRFYLKFGLNNKQIVATRAANEILLHLVKLVLYIQFGLFSLQVLKIGLTIALAATLSSFVIKKVLPKISATVFHKVGFSAMVLSGIMMLIGFISKAKKEQNAEFYTSFVKKGFNSHLTWAEDNYTLEFRVDESFELEHLVKYADLPVEVKEKARSVKIRHKFEVYEAVHTLSGREMHEMYLLDEHKDLIKTIDL